MDLRMNLCWSKLNGGAFFAVGAIKDSHRLIRGIADCVDKINALDVSGLPLFLGKVLLSILVVCSLLTAGQAAAEGLNVRLKSIAQIAIDDDGNPLRYPTSVFFDPVEEEIYVTNSGSSRVVVYGPRFFPRISIAKGRGLITPRGLVVMSDGEVYVCQPRDAKNPRARITVLNAAFFIDRDIFLDNIPEAADFIPNQLAVSADGNIYLAGISSRGVLVLDNEGNFLRRLQPLDKIMTREKVEEADEVEKQPEEEDPLLADIPEEFRPRKSRQEGGSRLQESLGPVKINFVNIDSTGKLYLGSNETSKIYVYGPDEAFLFTIGEKGGTPRHLSQPKSMAIDEKRGVIYVVDYMRQCILTYDMSGKYLFEFGGRGIGPGWFNYPIGLAVNSHGQVIVADLFNNRVQVLELENGKISPLLEIGSPAGTSPAGPEAEESTGHDELVPGPEVISDRGKASEAGISVGQGKPEEVGDQEKTPAQPMAQPEPPGQMGGEQPNTPE